MWRFRKAPQHGCGRGSSGSRCARILSLFGRLVLPVSLALILLPGCGGDTLTVPVFAPEETAQRALAEYDANHDGFLDAKELERCPGLKSSLDSIDQNGDHRLSADELAGRIRIYQESEVALKHVGCSVFLDGRPLEGATVTYVPEKFMGTSIKQASGVSNARGSVELTAEGEKLPGAQPGFYQVRVSKKNASGHEMIPARYNEETTLGIEVYPRKKSRKVGVKDDEGGIFKLSSKSK